ncbi:MAG: hypothetical protein A2X94_08455 [Bdellovibrionales bacterium GWB1_55_8]|nr:MAG: hypothetical protein A2X94_08455 [Bdellovibrionales bacterium GWB1_55_8]
MAGAQRGIFLINRKFQVRFAIFVCGWLLALSFIYPVIVYNMFEYFAGQMSGAAADRINKTGREILILLGMFQVIFLVLTFLISIFISHRIAGPIYKLRKFMEEARNGVLRDDLSFRKKDHFSEIAGDYNDMIRSMRSQIERRKQAIAATILQIERLLPDASDEQRRSLETLLADLKRA